MSKEKERLDVLLVTRGLAASRAQAQALILAGQVRAGDRPPATLRPGTRLPVETELAVEAGLPYVSRGGVKLAHALDAFDMAVAGRVCLDVGASTGGFTDCLLQRGAARVYAVDVGYGQLAWALRQDPRVVALDRTNIRYLERLPESVSVATIDVSFISLGLVLPAVLPLLDTTADVVALIKPQFEAGRRQVGKGGVVRDPAVHRQVLTDVLARAQELGLAVRGLTVSPITGPAGNHEFLAWLAWGAVGVEPALDTAAAIEECLGQLAPDR
ncbi:MAG: TlyA family RNA methyltransferase [Chloroflexi bacterium]|nr:TlyA family RNA methyltransferase [Chloroflexota bacterium]MBU1750311.1 TlyA family RNA methyltransferase [Chloroflexota bacterium]